MKKIILLLLLSTLPALSEDTANTIYLDLNAGEEHEYKKFKPTIENLNISDNDENNEDYIYHPMKYIKSEARELYKNKLKF